MDDRLTLLNDQLALAQAGKFGTPDLLELMESYREEKNYSVWECLQLCINRVRFGDVFF